MKRKRTENGEEEIDYCKFSCGKPIHKTCFAMWCKKKAANCVYCSAPWEGKKLSESDYINLLCE